MLPFKAGRDKPFKAGRDKPCPYKEVLICYGLAVLEVAGFANGIFSFRMAAW